MKKIAGLMVCAALITANASAFAADAAYTVSNDSAAVTGAGSFSTVLINKVEVGSENTGATAENTVYLDQALDAYSGAGSFLIKADPDPGKYRVRLGSESGETQELYFYVGLPASGDDLAMTRLGEERNTDGRTYNVGYSLMVEADEIADYASVKIGINANNPSYGGFELKAKNWENISGSITLIFQLNDVPAAYKDAVSVYLSKTAVTAEKIADDQGGE